MLIIRNGVIKNLLLVVVLALLDLVIFILVAVAALGFALGAGYGITNEQGDVIGKGLIGLMLITSFGFSFLLNSLFDRSASVLKRVFLSLGELFLAGGIIFARNYVGS